MPPTTGQPVDLEPQRVSARARLVVAQRDGRTRLSRLYQEGSASIRLLPNAGDPLEAVLINTAGGLTGGDRIRWSVDVGAGAAAAVTTQAYEKIYRANAGRAEAHCSLRVGSGARLAWLPQETIVFDRASFSRRLDADLDEGARALFVEFDCVRPPGDGRKHQPRDVPGSLADQEERQAGPCRGLCGQPECSGDPPAVRRHRRRYRGSNRLARRGRCSGSSGCGPPDHRRPGRGKRLGGPKIWQASCEAFRQ